MQPDMTECITRWPDRDRTRDRAQRLARLLRRLLLVGRSLQVPRLDRARTYDRAQGHGRVLRRLLLANFFVTVLTRQEKVIACCL